MEELLKEKTEWERKIALRESEREQATNDIYYFKKHLKITEARIALEKEQSDSAPKTDAEALKEIAEGMK